MRQVLLVATFDSQLKWCGGIRTAFEAAGFTCRVVVPDVRSALSAGQIRDAGFSTVERVAWAELVDRALRSDVVVCALSGPLITRLVVDLWARRDEQHPGPVLVAGWVGVIIEKIVAGYLDRSMLDVVAVNSRQDLAVFRTAADRLGLPTDNLLLTGLPVLSGRPPEVSHRPVRRVLFADQPTVPGRPEERVHLYRRLVAYAVRHPDREVRLKPRHRPGEDTFHPMEVHPEDVIAGWDLPPNFRVDYTPIATVLADTDLLLTVSSTACLEALDRGCRVALVLDLGVHERHGNQVFLESGLLRTFAQIGRDELGDPDPTWLDGYFFARSAPPAELVVGRTLELLDRGERPHHAAWATDYFASVVDYRTQVRASRPTRRALRRRLSGPGRALRRVVRVAVRRVALVRGTLPRRPPRPRAMP
jgi:hypothetical protein